MSQAGMAMCFGVQCIATSSLHVAFSRAGMLSDDGRCKTYDQSANGYVRGEGCGGVLIERMEEEGENMIGKIVGFAINQDGRSNGLTAPKDHLKRD
jgi:acyl transferase domain-containing protein